MSLGRALRGSAAAAIAVLCCAGLVGCAPEPDPEAIRESLSEVSEETAPPTAAERYDAETHPDPVVEPVACSPYLVITARGTGESSQDQLLSPVAEEIAEAKPGKIEVVDLDYPANTDVNEGGTVGVRTLIDTLNVQTEACPEQSFVLLGYSQGALVVSDALSEPGERVVGGTVGALAPEAVDSVRAIVLYGNPRFVGSEPYNAGDFDPGIDGVLRNGSGALAAFAERMADYCAARDFICQASLDLDEKGHVSYYSNGMQAEGADFAIARLDPVGERH